MKTLLARFSPKRSIGVAIDGREVAISLMAFTPLGAQEVGRRAEPIGDGPVGAALRRALGPVMALKAWRRAPVVVGLPPLGIFFSTRPIKKAKGEDASAQMLLHEVLQSPSVVIDDMEVDLIRARPFRQPVASIAACRKKALAPILEALQDCGVRPTRVEPGPCGLLRAALARHRGPRRARTVLRVFLGREEGLAILAADGLPLMWRGFALEAGAEAEAILSTYRATSNLCRYYGIDSKIDAVAVHGRPELTGLTTRPEWAELPGPAGRHDGPSFHGGEVAAGLALGGQSPGEGAFNLARAVAPPVPISSLIPWSHLVLQAALLVGATLLMVDGLWAIRRARTVTQTELAAIERPEAATNAQLRDQRKALSARIGAVQRYLETRILWTECLDEVAGRLPASMAATRISGECRFEPRAVARGRVRRSLRVEVEAPSAGEEETVPPEVGPFLDTLRASGPLRKALPSIEIAGLRRAAATQNRGSTTSFTVVCEPESTKKSRK